MFKLKLYHNGIVNSYGQIFFSNHQWFGYLLLLASFVDPYIGICGLIAAAVSVVFADWMGYNHESIRSGLYSYNSILVGFTIGVFYQFNFAFFGLLILGSFFTMLISVWLAAFFSSYRIPFLSLPFLLGVWAVMMGARGFNAVELSERGIFTINELYSFWGPEMGKLMADIHAIKFPLLIDVYLKSLGAIFFQYNLLVGLIIALGLLIYSRIAFSLSILGFLTGYYFCDFFQANMTELEYSYIGFNYILSSIALGGFFLIPSWRSYLMVMVSATMIALSISALGKLFFNFGLPIYSLPFSLVVMLLLYALLQRYNTNGLNLVQYQLYSPEKNLYAYHHRLERYKNDTYFHIHLPFYGEWFVSQGHEGKITHKEDWRFAFDFVVVDETQKTFKGSGEEVNDFYCYDLPVLSPAAGYVVTLVDGVEDNLIGDVNLGENWGNAIVIKHGDFLYSKITHIKDASFKVKLGDYVKKGEVLATCGNSGRSPEPHIHFQLQSTPFVGAKTLKYPIAYYVSKLNGKFTFHSFDYPLENQNVFRITPTNLISQAFYFVPGMTMEFKVENGAKKSLVKWEVFTDALNQSYIYCGASQSYAYFVNNDTLHYFTDFKGDKKSLLYYFYIAAHKILMGYFQDLEVKDILPVDGFFSGESQFIQDFIAPFKIYQKVNYSSTFKKIDDVMNPQYIKIISSAVAQTAGSVHGEMNFTLELSNNKISQLTINDGEKCISAKRII